MKTGPYQPLPATSTDQTMFGRFDDLNCAFVYCITTRCVDEAVVRHDCDPVSAHLLGRALTAAQLYATVQPERTRVNLLWTYEGTLRTLLVDTGQDGCLRGFISPRHIKGTVEDVDALYGDKGSLRVMLSRDDKVLQTSTTEVLLQDPVSDLAYHACISDQIETGITAMIAFRPDPVHPVSLCQGWMLQPLPGTDPALFDRLRREMGQPAFRDLMSRPNEADVYFEMLAKALLDGAGLTSGLSVRAAPPPRFQCTCDLEKMGAILRAIPIPERMQIVKAGEPLTVRCQFCNSAHNLSIEQCSRAWNNKPMV